MGINSTSFNAVRGIQQGFHNMRRIAADVASANVQSAASSSSDLARSLVEMQQAAHQTHASVKVAKTANKLIGTLIDIKA